MLPLLLLLVTAQVPGETTLVSFCKQGRLSACEALKQTNPQRAVQLKAELAKAAARQAALKAAEEGTQEQQAAEDAAAAADAAPESCDCTGQDHHIISNPIAKALKDHKTLRGLYEPRDKRWVATAKDLQSHCGYQQWHRDLDREVIEWLEEFPQASQKQFEALLKEIYRRPEMLQRFPHGFRRPPAPTLLRPQG